MNNNEKNNKQINLFLQLPSEMSFDDNLKDVFPYVYRLISEHRKPQDLGPEFFNNDYKSS